MTLVAAEIAAVKSQPGTDILLHCGPRLLATLEFAWSKSATDPATRLSRGKPVRASVRRRSLDRSATAAST